MTPPIEPLLKYQGTLLRRTPGPVDEYGDPTWVEASEPTKCWLEPMGSREELGSGEAVQFETYRLFLPADVPPTGWDAIVVSGATYELEGDALTRTAPRGSAKAHHVEAYVRATDAAPLQVTA